VLQYSTWYGIYGARAVHIYKEIGGDCTAQYKYTIYKEQLLSSSLQQVKDCRLLPMIAWVNRRRLYF
jgi:hypothetical protein